MYMPESRRLLGARACSSQGKCSPQASLLFLAYATDSSRTDLYVAPLALRAAKTAIDAVPYTPLEEGLDLERRVYNGLLLTEDRNEGLRAFAEKRRAVFTGK
jgi:enoyl-CoA hydratase/carnithine racemase